jgi:predicted nucleotidyltransferase
MKNWNEIQEDCKHNLLYLTYGGSNAYGTNVEGSDIDLRGICYHKPIEIYGTQNFEQYVDTVNDITIYSISKIIKLLINANPNTIELLGTRDKDIFFIDQYGQLLRNNVDLFVTQKCIKSFGGYAFAQLRRLQNALSRDYSQDDKEEHIMKSIKGSFDHLKKHYRNFGDEDIKLYTDTSTREGYSTEIYIDCNLKRYPLRDFKDVHNEMSQTIKNYASIGKRNDKKDDKSLYKHGMHLIRLYLMCIDMLEGNGICTYRKNDRELLLDIRNENYTFEDIFQMVDEYEKKMEYAVKHTELPKQPNLKKIEDLLVTINKASV